MAFLAGGTLGYLWVGRMKKRRFNKDDWLMHGVAELSAKGSEAVKLEAICKSAGLTRGSFYHHFEDHEAYLTGLASKWLEIQTDAVAQAVDPSDPIVMQGEALSEAAMAIDYRLELGIRELGRRLPAVEEIVRRADNRRLSVVTDLYRKRYDLDKEQAAAFAYLEYAAFSGIILLDPDMPTARQRALAALFDTTIAKALGRDA